MIFCIVGKSCSGKTTLQRELNEKFNAEKIVTYTTRKPRIDEVNGFDYNFISIEEFKEKLNKDEIISPDTYGGNFYGFPKNEKYDSEENVFTTVLTVSGAKELKNNYSNVKIIYLFADDKTRFKLSMLRNDGSKTIKERFYDDSNVNYKNLYEIADIIIENNGKNMKKLLSRI
jgi:guanylate kinase